MGPKLGQARFLEIWKSGTRKSGILGSNKSKKIRILKIRIRSAQNVGEVFLCRKRASPPHLGPSQPIFCVGRKNPKITKNMWQLAFKHKRFQRRLADRLYHASCKPGGPQQIPRAISTRLQKNIWIFSKSKCKFRHPAGSGGNSSKKVLRLKIPQVKREGRQDVRLSDLSQSMHLHVGSKD